MKKSIFGFEKKKSIFGLMKNPFWVDEKSIFGFEKKIEKVRGGSQTGRLKWRIGGPTYKR